ncbi:MAG: hypothetical protein PHP30_07325 [Bacteroidales bacterium]|nr:hypothetical protein [Bacteroidales bacterium]MDD4638293.1 hypothetical protein [Bacteroidales bacterium]
MAVLISNSSIFEFGKEHKIGIRIMNLETAPGVPLTTTLVVSNRE